MGSVSLVIVGRDETGPSASVEDNYARMVAFGAFSTQVSLMSASTILDFLSFHGKPVVPTSSPVQYYLRYSDLQYNPSLSNLITNHPPISLSSTPHEQVPRIELRPLFKCIVQYNLKSVPYYLLAKENYCKASHDSSFHCLRQDLPHFVGSHWLAMPSLHQQPNQFFLLFRNLRCNLGLL